MGQPNGEPKDDKGNGTSDADTGRDDKDGTDSKGSSDNDSGKGSGEPDAKKASDGLKADLAKERKARQELERKLRAKEREGLDETERLKAEHGDATAKVAEQEATIESLRKELLQMTIAVDLKLPLRVARRLQGADEAEMRADAQEFLKDLNLGEGEGRGKRPPNDGKKGRGSGSGAPDMNTLLRLAAGR